ncbi:hypothetical protein Lesp02_02960 [Lentzea sp. NBRC 105346]|uniref:hypothetical protein n=1 Tax=Lentzea sp. NBRC 105346 TaxID=3032205 RepID=UPI0024A350CB|nr:hypothetical protein [Lentzea sp. NBRC 105346]GLZ28106.1 hypothetical protein Lesp02_02960 [Lentzea sp. NBRC 105346]
MGSRNPSIKDLMNRQQWSAQRVAEQAGQRHAARCIASATALLRTVFPDAAEVVVDLSDWYDNTGSVNLNAILDHERTVLWRHTDIPRKECGGSTPLPAEIMLAREQVEEAWNAFVRDAANYFELALDFGYPDTLGWEHVDPTSGDYTGL